MLIILANRGIAPFPVLNEGAISKRYNKAPKVFCIHKNTGTLCNYNYIRSLNQKFKHNNFKLKLNVMNKGYKISFNKKDG